MRSALCLASVCVASVAHGQSTLTLYGVMDNGIEFQNGGAGSAVRAVSSGLFATVYGLRGAEDLGGGTILNFTLEQGFSGETGAATVATAAFNRLAWIGIAGTYGEFRLGRQKKPEYLFLNAQMDPTAVKSFASPINNFQDPTVRANNAITYFSPTIMGLTAQVMVAMRDSTTKPQNGLELYNGVLRYLNGPFHAVIGYEQWGSATGTTLQRVFRSGVSYDFGHLRLYAAFESEKLSNHTEDLDIYALSASYAFNPANFLSVLYGYAHDKTGQGNNAQQLGTIYEYFFSKRTILYAAGGVIQNRNYADFTLDGTQYSGIAGAPGGYAKAVILGMTHKF
nr:porin [Robbsia betulipollinis]